MNGNHGLDREVGVPLWAGGRQGSHEPWGEVTQSGNTGPGQGAGKRTLSVGLFTVRWILVITHFWLQDQNAQEVREGAGL